MEAEVGGDGAVTAAGGTDDEVEAVAGDVVDEVEMAGDAADLGEEVAVSLWEGLLSTPVLVSSSDCRNMGSMCGAYLV